MRACLGYLGVGCRGGCRARRDFGRGQERGKLFYAGASNAMQHCVISRCPRIAVPDLFRFFAADTDRANFILTKNIPNPGHRGLVFRYFDCEIATDAISGRLFPRNHREVPRLRFLIEISDQLLELGRRQSVQRIESNRRTTRLGDRHCLTVGVAPP